MATDQEQKRGEEIHASPRLLNRPPQVEVVIPETVGVSDPGYTLQTHLNGLRGTWHRLWALLVLAEREGPEDMEDGVAIVRQQFEQLLGRTMTAEEWSKLDKDAKAFAKAQAKS